MHELISVFTLLIICLAFWGHGNLILESFPKNNHYDPAISTALGICAFILICGYFELFHLASPFSLFLFVTIGVLVSLWNLKKKAILGIKTNQDPLPHYLFQTSNLKSSLTSLLGILITVVCIFITLIYFYHLPLNYHDDFSGYLVLAKRILDEGYQGGDPFNDRSIEQGFGAGNYLVALLTSLLPDTASHLADAGIGLILLALGVLSIYKNSNTSKPFLYPLICIVFLCAIVVNAPIVNISPLIIAAGLFVASICFYIQSNYGEHYSDHIVLALLLSSFLVLKGNYVIPVCASTLSIYLSRITIAKFERVFFEFVIFVCSMLVFTFPWMIANWQFAKTPFYPLLGHGLVSPNALSLASFDQFADANLTLLPYYIILICLLALLHKFKRAIDYRFLFFITILSLTIIFLSFALTLTSAGSISRYSYVSLFGPIAFLTLYLIYNFCIKELILSEKHRIYNFLVLFVLIGFSIPYSLDTIKRSSKELAKMVFNTGVKNSQLFDFKNDRHRINELQNNLPLNSTVLLRLDMPFLVDFHKQKFHVMDWPGNVGPKPGVPYDQPPEALAQYLREQGIRYVAYSYANEALFSIKDPELASRQNHSNPWIRTQAVRTFAVQKQLKSLGDQYPRVFDNGQDFLIDLSQGTIPQIAK
jgi:hypothetical protein